MINTIKSSKFFLIFFISFWYSLIFSGLPSGTKIITPKGFEFIENLSNGNKIIGYDPINNSYPQVEIQNIKSHFNNEIFEISTDKGIIYTSQDQLFYDDSTKKFLHANELCSSSILIKINGEKCKFLENKKINKEIKLYEVTLKEPHLFFSTDLQLLTHNMTIPLPLLTYIGEWVLGLCIIAKASFNGPPKIFNNIEQAREEIKQECINFSDRHFNLAQTNYNSIGKFIGSSYNFSIIPGIKADPNIHNVVGTNSLNYGPMCVSAKIMDDGDIEATLHMFYYSEFCEDDWTYYYNKKEIGRGILKRDNPLVKNFVDIKYVEEINELREYLKTWPQFLLNNFFKIFNDPEQETNYLKARYPGCYEKLIFGTWFDIHAVCQMINRNIAPSLIKYTLKYGKYFQANHPNRLIYFDEIKNFAFVFDKNTRKVLHAGLYKQDIGIINPPYPENSQENKEKEKAEEEKKQKEKADKEKAEKEKAEKEKIEKEKEEKEKAEKDAEKREESDEKIKKVLEETDFIRDKYETLQVQKKGGIKKAKEDFEDMGLSDVKDIPQEKNKGKIGVLPDGRVVNVREKSDYGNPTLEIYDPKTKRKIKIRYI